MKRKIVCIRKDKYQRVWQLIQMYRVRKVLDSLFQGYFLITPSHVIAFLFGSVAAINQVF